MFASADPITPGPSSSYLKKKATSFEVAFFFYAFSNCKTAISGGLPSLFGGPQKPLPVCT